MLKTLCCTYLSEGIKEESYEEVEKRSYNLSSVKRHFHESIDS